MRRVVGFILSVMSGVPASFDRDEEKLPKIGWPARIALAILLICLVGVYALFLFAAPQQ